MTNNKKITIIAEAGVNHNGNLKNALKMVDEAAKLKIDFIKFQTFEPDLLSSPNLGLAKYQKKFSSKINHLEMLKKLTLTKKDFKKIILRCKKKKIKFLSSPFDIKSIFLLKDLNVKTLKIPSGQIDDIPYLEILGSLKKKIILSTGASNLKEIKNAINILIKQGTSKKDITILHCVSQYPTDISNLNLASITFLKKKTKFKIGFSDHSLGYEAAILAIGLGARVIEKHFTLNKLKKGPDHKFSLNINELTLFVKKIREAEKSLGICRKKINKYEKLNLSFIRKKIVANNDILRGQVFTKKNITTKRSLKGLPAAFWNKVLGKKSKKNFKSNEGISL